MSQENLINIVADQSEIIYELTDVLRNIINGVETGAITSDHEEIFNNVINRARSALMRSEEL